MIAARLLLYAVIFLRSYFSVLRRDDHWAAYVWVSIVLHAIGLIALPWALEGHWQAIAIIATSFALAYPWLLARHIFVRLSLWRAAYAFGWLARITWGPEGHGAAAAAAWALHRSRRPSTRGLDFVAARLRAAKLSSSTIFASALVASARGDRRAARTLLESLATLDPANNRLAHQLAGDFLLADAASVGDWRRVRRIACSWEPQSRTSRFFAAVARRLLGETDGPTDSSLLALWSLAPHRRRTRSLLALARAANGDDAASDHWPAPQSLAAPTTGDAVGRALAVHLELARRGAGHVELDDVVTLARAWDEVETSGALTRITNARAADLESRSPARISAEFLGEVETDLASMVRDSGHRLDHLPDDSPALSRATAAVREEMLGNVEVGFAALEDRTEDKRALPAIDEWREFIALRALHADLARAGGESVRRLAFAQLHHAACNHAAWLWNERSEYILANAIFRWLLAEATIVGDERAIELQRRNCDVV